MTMRLLHSHRGASQQQAQETRQRRRFSHRIPAIHVLPVVVVVLPLLLSVSCLCLFLCLLLSPLLARHNKDCHSDDYHLAGPFSLNKEEVSASTHRDPSTTSNPISPFLPWTPALASFASPKTTLSNGDPRPQLLLVSDWTWTFATQPNVLSDSCATDAAFAQASPVYEVVPGVRLAFKRLPANCSTDPRRGEDYVYITMWLWQEEGEGVGTGGAGIGTTGGEEEGQPSLPPPPQQPQPQPQGVGAMRVQKRRPFGVASVAFSELGAVGGVFTCLRAAPSRCFDSQGTKFVVRRSTSDERAARNLTLIETGTDTGGGGGERREVYHRVTMRVRAEALELPTTPSYSSSTSSVVSRSAGSNDDSKSSIHHHRPVGAYGDKRVAFALGGGMDLSIDGPAIHATSTRADIAALYVNVDSGAAEEIVLRRTHRNLAWIIIGATSGGLILLLGLFVTIVRPQGEGCGLWLRATSSGPLTWCVPLSSLPAVLFLGLMLVYLAIMITLATKDYQRACLTAPLFRAFGDGAILLFAFVMVPPLKHVNIIATRVFGASVERLIKMHVVVGGLLFLVLSVHFGGMWWDLWVYKYGIRIVAIDSPRRNLFGLIAFATMVLGMVIPGLLRHRNSATFSATISSPSSSAATSFCGCCWGGRRYRIRYYTLFKALHLLWVVVFVCGALHNIDLLYAALPGIALFVFDRLVVHAVTFGAKTIATAEGLRPGGDAVDDRNDTRTLVVGATLDEGAGVATVRLSMRREVLATTALQWLSPLCLGRCWWNVRGVRAGAPAASVCLFRDLPPAQYVHLGATSKIPVSHPVTIANIAPARLSGADPAAKITSHAKGGVNAEASVEASPSFSSSEDLRPVDPLRAIAVFHIRTGRRGPAGRGMMLPHNHSPETAVPQGDPHTWSGALAHAIRHMGSKSNKDNCTGDKESKPASHEQHDRLSGGGGSGGDDALSTALAALANELNVTYGAPTGLLQVDPTSVEAAVLVCGGIGVTPMCSLLEHLGRRAVAAAAEGGDEGARAHLREHCGCDRCAAELDPSERAALMRRTRRSLRHTVKRRLAAVLLPAANTTDHRHHHRHAASSSTTACREECSAERAPLTAAGNAHADTHHNTRGTSCGYCSTSDAGPDTDADEAAGRAAGAASLRHHLAQPPRGTSSVTVSIQDHQYRESTGNTTTTNGNGHLGLLRDVHVVWVNRGAGPAGLLEGSLLPHVALLERFSGVRVHMHLFDTQHKGPGGAITGRAEAVQGGRPDLAKIMDAALGGRDAPRVGVFSCGPAPLMATARLEAGRRGLLLHEETFHF